jgi:hypothetical protein
MNINPENALSIQHKEWLNHPVTKQMLQILDYQKEHTIDAMASSASIDIDASWFKEQAGNIKTINVIKSWITNTEQFIQQLTK